MNSLDSQLQADPANSRQVLSDIVLENEQNNGESIEGEKIPKVPDDPGVANFNLLTALNDDPLGHCILAYGKDKTLNPALCR